MAKVVLERITKRFPGGNEVLRDLDLEIRDGELTVLAGPSGSGKTTILRLIAGLEQPDRGRIFIGDRDVTNTTPHRRNVTMVFQRPALYPHWSVRRNLAFGLGDEVRPRGEALDE